ncbi:MAG TPA: hypothetical protein VEW68_10180, partial [Patescibacteria group bacterium]|nr:hypothetical protein [Patescibacteria group bacterium]
TGVGRLEFGLHFEGERQHNAEAYDFFRSRMVEVKARLPRAELEPWDRGWVRLYETVPAAQLDGDAVDRGAALMAAYISALEPLLQAFLAG